MKPDHDSKPLLEDVLQGDHDALRASSLGRMLSENRRAKRTKRNIRRAGVVALLLAFASIGLFMPRVQRNDAVTNIEPANERTPHQIAVRQLSDAELHGRLGKFAVAYVGGAANKRIVMIEAWTP